jgi:hypothetical protein
MSAAFKSQTFGNREYWKNTRVDKAWLGYMYVLSISCCTVLAALLKFEAFFREAFPTSGGLVVHWLMSLLKPNWGGEGSSVGLFYYLNTLSSSHTPSLPFTVQCILQYYFLCSLLQWEKVSREVSRNIREIFNVYILNGSGHIKFAKISAVRAKNL